MRHLTAVFTVSALMGMGAPAHAETPEVLQGTWAGRAEPSARAGAVLHVDGARLVLVEGAEVAVGSATYAVNGPGTKDGRLMFAVDWKVAGRFGADGKAVRGAPMRLGSFLVGDDEARLCFADTKKAAERPRAGAAADAPRGAPVRCYTLARVARAVAGSDDATRPRTVPRFDSPDGSAPNAPTALEEAVRGSTRMCMDECRARSQMRAVSPEQIEQDCAKGCGLAIE